MKRRLAFLIALVMVVSLLWTANPVEAAKATKYGKNYQKALKLYKIDTKNVYVAKKGADQNAITALTKEAAKTATQKKMAMVYVPAGTHKLKDAIRVPANVVLVSEKDTVYIATKKMRKMASVSGSVYGGKWDCNKKSDIVIWFNYVKFKGKNGEVRSCSMKNGCADAIHYGSCISKIRLGGAKAIGNTIYNFYLNGITAVNTGSFKEISGNKITKIGHDRTGSGLSITHANVGTIKNNIIRNCKGHGISTDTDQTQKTVVQKTVTINLIEGNDISDIGVHGIYLDENVLIRTIKNNKITNSKMVGLDIDLNSKVGLLNGNTITNCDSGNINLNGGKGSLVIGSNNIIKNSKTIGLAVGPGAKVTIKGTKNVIMNNENNVRVYESGGAKFVVKKNGNKIGQVFVQ